jgi:hypothetical protein
MKRSLIGSTVIYRVFPPSNETRTVIVQRIDMIGKHGKPTFAGKCIEQSDTQQFNCTGMDVWGYIEDIIKTTPESNRLKRR